MSATPLAHLVHSCSTCQRTNAMMKNTKSIPKKAANETAKSIILSLSSFML